MSPVAIPGYVGKIVVADLASGAINEEPLDPKTMRRVLGGNGLAAYLLHRHAKPGCEALGPDNAVVFATGPLNGTGFICSDRFCVASKSPLTGFFFDSYSGGGFALGLKQCCDALVIKGSASEPSYLFVGDSLPSHRMYSASQYWTKDTQETIRLLAERHGKGADVVAIGEAGENAVRFACVMCPGSRAAGRGGLGAVLGSKKLKAVVALGSHKPEIHDLEAMKKLEGELKEKMKTAPVVGNLRRYGTTLMTTTLNNISALPTRNWRSARFEGAHAVSEEQYEKLFSGSASCRLCPIGCGKKLKLSDGRLVKSPEFETIFAFGSNLGCDDKDFIARANELCNLLGLDTITTGSVLGFAMECRERKVKDFGVKWGDRDGALAVIQSIARKQGVGVELAEGTRRLSEKYPASKEFTVNIKGLEPAGYAPAGISLMALGYATSTRGGSHQDTRPLVKPVSEAKEENLPGIAFSCENRTAIQDSLVMCRFMEQIIGTAINEDYLRLVNALTGFDYSTEELGFLGERIYNLERLFSIREGLKGTDDSLPDRLRLSVKVDVEKLLDQYYKLRGWDSSGTPTAETRARLGLAELV